MLSETSEHVLRAVRWVAARPAGTAVTAGEIAAGSAVSRAYLNKILRKLTKAGILAARRGVGGGYRLNRRPQDILVSELVAPFEPRHDPGVCVFSAGLPCASDRACALHDRWATLDRQKQAILGCTTLAELAPPLVGDGPAPAPRCGRACEGGGAVGPETRA